jgi:hypothetical protein
MIMIMDKSLTTPNKSHTSNMSVMVKALPAEQQATARNTFQNIQTYRNNSHCLELLEKPTRHKIRFCDGGHF